MREGWSAVGIIGLLTDAAASIHTRSTWYYAVVLLRIRMQTPSGILPHFYAAHKKIGELATIKHFGGIPLFYESALIFCGRAPHSLLLLYVISGEFACHCMRGTICYAAQIDVGSTEINSGLTRRREIERDERDRKRERAEEAPSFFLLPLALLQLYYYSV